MSLLLRQVLRGADVWPRDISGASRRRGPGAVRSFPGAAGFPQRLQVWDMVGGREGGTFLPLHSRPALQGSGHFRLEQRKSTEQNKPLQVQVQRPHEKRGESNPQASVADLNYVSLCSSWKSAVNGVAFECWWTGSSYVTSPTRWPRWLTLTPCGSKAI